MEPTRIATKSSTIDLIFTDSLYIKESGSLIDAISDHQFVYLIRKKLRNTNQSSTTRGRSYQHFDLNEFKDFIDNKLLEKDISNLDTESM